MVDDKQTALNSAWEVVNVARDSNNNPRFNWVALLGMSITTYVRRCVGLSSDEIYDKIIKEYPYLTPEAQRRLRINVSASFTYVNGGR